MRSVRDSALTGYLLLVPLALLIGVSLGLLGGGGSILTVPVLVYGFGLEAKAAVATSLAVVGVTSLVGAWRHTRQGAVDFPVAAAFGLFGMLGASLGSRIAALPSIPGGVLLVAFAALMIVVAVLMLRARPKREGVGKPARVRLGRVAVYGFLTGVLTGTLGVGGGFVIVPALLLTAGLTMHRAIGSSLVVIFLNCAAGLVGFSGRVPIDWKLAAGFAVFGAAGSLLGAYWARRARADRLRRGFGVFVLVLGGFMLFDQLRHSIG